MQRDGGVGAIVDRDGDWRHRDAATVDAVMDACARWWSIRGAFVFRIVHDEHVRSGHGTIGWFL